MKSHTGVCISLGTGCFYAKPTGQKINTTSSCQAELVAAAKGLQQSIYSRSRVPETHGDRAPRQYALSSLSSEDSPSTPVTPEDPPASHRYPTRIRSAAHRMHLMAMADS